MTHPLTPREKPLGQIAYDGWAQGLPGCEWDNQTETQKRAWSKAADAILTALASGSGDHAELARLAEAALHDPQYDGHSFETAANPATVLALIAENAALRSSLTKANDGFEEYERKFYLEQHAREEAERKLAEAVGLLRKFSDAWRSGCGWLPSMNALDDEISEFLSKEAERG